MVSLPLNRGSSRSNHDCGFGRESFRASMVLKHYEDEGSPPEDLPLIEWCCRELLYQAQEHLHGVLRNFPVRWLAALMRMCIFPRGRTYFAPSDRLARQVGDLALAPGSTRTRAKAALSVSKIAIRSFQHLPRYRQPVFKSLARFRPIPCSTPARAQAMTRRSACIMIRPSSRSRRSRSMKASTSPWDFR